MDRENNYTASKNKQSKYGKLYFIEHSSEYYVLESFTWIPLQILYIHGHFKLRNRKLHVLMIQLIHWAWAACVTTSISLTWPLVKTAQNWLTTGDFVRVKNLQSTWFHICCVGVGKSQQTFFTFRVLFDRTFVFHTKPWRACRACFTSFHICCVGVGKSQQTFFTFRILFDRTFVFHTKPRKAFRARFIRYTIPVLQVRTDWRCWSCKPL